MSDPIQCDYCGRFISFDELESGAAQRNLITPDSDLTYEEWETYHVKCERVADLV